MISELKENSPYSQIRQDPIAREWVIYAPERSYRPHDSTRWRNRPHVEAYDPQCPFCPGNESILGCPVLCEAPPMANGDSWGIRVVPNRYPALRSDVKPNRVRRDLCLCMNGYGRQEVIIENPRHNADLPDYSPAETEALLQIYQGRYNEMLLDPKVAMVSVFRNHGPWAGTSLIHPHSQVIATPTVTRSMRQREEQSQEYFDEIGRCLFCDLIALETESRCRLVAAGALFAAFVPFAARVPFETLVAPLRHTADFGTITAEERKELGKILLSVIGRLANKLEGPDYNLIIHSYTRYKAEEPHLHWYAQILPRTQTRAGFEMGTGFSINPTYPEHNAEILGCVDTLPE